MSIILNRELSLSFLYFILITAGGFSTQYQFIPRCWPQAGVATVPQLHPVNKLTAITASKYKYTVRPHRAWRRCGWGFGQAWSGWAGRQTPSPHRCHGFSAAPECDQSLPQHSLADRQDNSFILCFQSFSLTQSNHEAQGTNYTQIAAFKWMCMNESDRLRKCIQDIPCFNHLF